MGDLRLDYPGATAVSRVRMAAGSLESLGRFTSGVTGARRVAMVTDSRVGALWGAAARRALQRAGVSVSTFTVAAGERSKRPDVLLRLWRQLAAERIGRGDAIVALGGGVVGDLAGFTAATWLRGIPWIGVPTTVLAQVDSSVGGKTGVDLPEGKNLVGAFHQPAGVLVDARVLETLPARHVRAGLAEVVKMGFAVDAPLFAWCERNADALAAGEGAALALAVARAIRVKARVVMADEREAEGGGRSSLNFGHTLGHAIEAARDYHGILHGEAVALGMRAAAELSESVAGLDRGARVRLEAMLDHLRLPLTMPATPLPALFTAMALDKKSARGEVRWVLTPRIGVASVPRAVPKSLVRAALRRAGARG